MTEPSSAAAALHTPVLLQRCVDLLAPALSEPGSVLIDGTLGMGGHTEAVLTQCPQVRVIGIDRDPAALELAGERLERFGDRFTPVHATYDEIDDVAARYAGGKVQGVLLDLGVSSLQLDDVDRGFSYMRDAPLDMRMDESAALTAREVVNTYSYEELRRILFEYGEERYAPAIAKRICQHREQKPIETTLELADIIRSAMPASALREKQHPAKRSFQAIRIAVNDELGELPPMLDAAEKNLKPGGRLAVITFHSLEDRIVKKKLQELAQGCICPPEFPVCVCGRKPKVKLITRKPIVSGEEELAENPRARSAKLRVAEKC